MKNSLVSFLLIILLTSINVAAQQKAKGDKKKKETASVAIVVDDRLSLLLSEPSLYAVPFQRMRRGRQLLVLSSKEADGVTFYEVKPSPQSKQKGWVQAEAVIGNFRRDDEGRLARLVQASDGFVKVERAMFFLTLFPKSVLRPSILLLLGDLVEEQALVLSKKASQKLDRREMAASGAPLHSFYLNFAGLDRYRRLGIRFLFNMKTKSYHYDGEAWYEIVGRFPKSGESKEAQRRLDLLKEKMERRG